MYVQLICLVSDLITHVTSVSIDHRQALLWRAVAVELLQPLQEYISSFTLYIATFRQLSGRRRVAAPFGFVVSLLGGIF